MKIDLFSTAKQFVQVGNARVAYYEEGSGPALLLLHGCPFSSFVWRKVIPQLATGYRCLAPDLLGLGDTETSMNADWSLRSQTSTVIEFLDALHIDCAHIIGHDHGGAVAQMIASTRPTRINRLILSNAEAYDNWPSLKELPYLRATQMPVVGDLMLWFFSLRPVLRYELAEAAAVYDRHVLTDELLDGYIQANLSDRHRRSKTKRFLAGQINPDNNRCTMDLLDGLKCFDRPTLLLWARDDPHFGPEWAERLKRDIPGVERLEILPRTGHLLMEERPAEFARIVGNFLAGEKGRAR
jgi:pimeloyl-ACP methyl ester carboxylesterase